MDDHGNNPFSMAYITARDGEDLDVRERAKLMIAYLGGQGASHPKIFRQPKPKTTVT